MPIAHMNRVALEVLCMKTKCLRCMSDYVKAANGNAFSNRPANLAHGPQGDQQLEALSSDLADHCKLSSCEHAGTCSLFIEPHLPSLHGSCCIVECQQPGYLVCLLNELAMQGLCQ